MRLQKIQKFLKNNDIDFNYSTSKTFNNDFGEIHIKSNRTTISTISEICGIRGEKPSEIMVFYKENNRTQSYTTTSQAHIIQRIEEDLQKSNIVNKATEIVQQIDSLENELYLHYEQFMKKDKIIEGLKDQFIDFIENNYFDLKRDDLKKIAISSMMQLNGTQLMNMYKDLEDRLIDYDEVMRTKQELEQRASQDKK